jgi:membrane dipeptidase
VDHIEHVVKLVGIDYVGIGTDFDGGGGVLGATMSARCSGDCELVRRGYSEKEIAQIWGGNIMRVFPPGHRRLPRLGPSEQEVTLLALKAWSD